MSDTNIQVPAVPEVSVEEQSKLIDLQTKKLALEAAALEIEERKYHIRDLRARLADRDILEKQAQEDRKHQGATFAQQEATDLYRFKICTHKKGGMASPRDLRVLTTGGNSAQFAVMKHQMINGDIWIRCLRCGKTWQPPVEKNFYFDKAGKQVAPVDGVFDKQKFDKEDEDYKAAIMFTTNNSMSTSVQCRFSRMDQGRLIDAADTYRENIASSNLR